MGRHSVRWASVRLPRSLAYGMIAVVWAVTVFLSTLVSVGGSMYQLALSAHILSLAVGFGAVVVVDWHGMLWVLGRRDLYETTRMAGATSPLVWAGLSGLLLSGIFLHPDLREPLIWVKLCSVLLVALNGVSVSALSSRLVTLPPTQGLRSITGGLRRQMIASATLSQLCWWSAIAIGMVSTAQRV